MTAVVDNLTELVSLSYCDPPTSPLPTIFFATKAFYGTISIFIYVLNVMAMRRGKISKTFYVLYTTCATVSSIFFVEYLAVKQFLSLGYLCEFIWNAFSVPNYTIAFTHVMAAYAPIAILVLHACIALHRVTAVVSPLTSRVKGTSATGNAVPMGSWVATPSFGSQIPGLIAAAVASFRGKAGKWDKRISNVWIAAMVLPFCFMWFEAPCKGFVVKSSQGGLDIKYEKTPDFLGFCTLSSTMFSVIAAVIFGLTTLISTLFMLYILKTKTVKVPDFGLIYFELIMAFVTFLYAATQIALYIVKYMNIPDPDGFVRNTVEIVRTYVIDIFILPQAWSLPIFSKIVRRSAIQVLRCAPQRKPNTTIMCVPDGRTMMTRSY